MQNDPRDPTKRPDDAPPGPDLPPDPGPDLPVRDNPADPMDPPIGEPGDRPPDPVAAKVAEHRHLERVVGALDDPQEAERPNLEPEGPDRPGGSREA